MCKSGKSEKILNFLPTEGMGCLFRVYTNMGRLSSVRLSLCVCFVCVTIILCACVCFCVFFRRLRANLANWMGEDSYCRGSIVHTRFGCSRALFVPPKSPTALWRFRASTSNSLSGRSRLHARTHMPYIYDTYAQQDIRECGDDHLQPPKRQYPNTKALLLLRKSI